jgi:hypothetical protein
MSSYLPEFVEESHMIDKRAVPTGGKERVSLAKKWPIDEK